MDESTQVPLGDDDAAGAAAPGATGAADPGPTTPAPPPDSASDPRDDTPVTVVTDPVTERAERGLWIWFAIVAVAMVASVLFNEAQFGLFTAAGGVFAIAHAVERVPRWRLLHRFLTALVTFGGALLFVSVILFLKSAPLPRLERGIGIGSGVFAALVCLAMLVPLFAHRLVRLLFRTPGSTPVTRLAARVVVISLLMTLPLWVTFRAMLALDMLKDMDLGGSSLWGSLLGLGLLSLGGVGTFVVRTPREALARLGLRRPVTGDLVWIPAGVVGLALLNGMIEWAQKTWFPAQWTFDQHVVGLMAGDLTRVETVMLGVSAGFGEELAMRGALQPRLGLLLTALLFAALHVQYSWTGMLTIVGFGLALGWVRLRSSTTTAIAIHAIYDMFAAFGAQKPH